MKEDMQYLDSSQNNQASLFSPKSILSQLSPINNNNNVSIVTPRTNQPSYLSDMGSNRRIIDSSRSLFLGSPLSAESNHASPDMKGNTTQLSPISGYAISKRSLLSSSVLPLLVNPIRLPKQPWEMEWEERRRATKDPTIKTRVIQEDQWDGTVMEGLWRTQFLPFTSAKKDWVMCRNDLRRLVQYQGITSIYFIERFCDLFDAPTHFQEEQSNAGLNPKECDIEGKVTSVVTIERTTSVSFVTPHDVPGAVGGHYIRAAQERRNKEERSFNGMYICKYIELGLTTFPYQDLFIYHCFCQFDRLMIFPAEKAKDSSEKNKIEQNSHIISESKLEPLDKSVSEIYHISKRQIMSTFLRELPKELPVEPLQPQVNAAEGVGGNINRGGKGLVNNDVKRNPSLVKLPDSIGSNNLNKKKKRPKLKKSERNQKVAMKSGADARMINGLKEIIKRGDFDKMWEAVEDKNVSVPIDNTISNIDNNNSAFMQSYSILGDTTKTNNTDQSTNYNDVLSPSSPPIIPRKPTNRPRALNHIHPTLLRFSNTMTSAYSSSLLTEENNTNTADSDNADNDKISYEMFRNAFLDPINNNWVGTFGRPLFEACLKYFTKPHGQLPLIPLSWEKENIPHPGPRFTTLSAVLDEQIVMERKKSAASERSTIVVPAEANSVIPDDKAQGSLQHREGSPIEGEPLTQDISKDSRSHNSSGHLSEVDNDDCQNTQEEEDFIRDMYDPTRSHHSFTNHYNNVNIGSKAYDNINKGKLMYIARNFQRTPMSAAPPAIPQRKWDLQSHWSPKPNIIVPKEERSPIGAVFTPMEDCDDQSQKSTNPSINIDCNSSRHNDECQIVPVIEPVNENINVVRDDSSQFRCDIVHDADTILLREIEHLDGKDPWALGRGKQKKKKKKLNK